MPFAAASNAATIIFNFLVVGVTAKVRKERKSTESQHKFNRSQHNMKSM